MSGIFYMERLIERIKAGEKVRVPLIHRKLLPDCSRYVKILPSPRETTVSMEDCLLEYIFEGGEYWVMMSYNATNNRHMATRKDSLGPKDYKYSTRTDVKTFLDLYTIPETKVRKIGKYKISRR